VAPVEECDKRLVLDCQPFRDAVARPTLTEIQMEADINVHSGPARGGTLRVLHEDHVTYRCHPSPPYESGCCFGFGLRPAKVIGIYDDHLCRFRLLVHVIPTERRSSDVK
jgi:hypothetical protein